jgi:hypothetical protein
VVQSHPRKRAWPAAAADLSRPSQPQPKEKRNPPANHPADPPIGGTPEAVISARIIEITLKLIDLALAGNITAASLCLKVHQGSEEARYAALDQALQHLDRLAYTESIADPDDDPDRDERHAAAATLLELLSALSAPLPRPQAPAAAPPAVPRTDPPQPPV